MSDDTALPPAAAARALIRASDRASLATVARAGAPGAGGPYASLVLCASDHDASPILLISRLADHTRNLEADPRAALLFDGTTGLASPLTGARATVVGRAQRSAEPRLRARFLARHPELRTFYEGARVQAGSTRVNLGLAATLLTGFGLLAGGVATRDMNMVQTGMNVATVPGVYLSYRKAGIDRTARTATVQHMLANSRRMPEYHIPADQLRLMERMGVIHELSGR